MNADPNSNPYRPSNAVLHAANAGLAAASSFAISDLARLEYGGFWLRVLATLIDGLILFVPQLLAEAALHTFFDGIGVQLLSTFVIWGAYCIPFWCSRLHATPGKLACGLVVLSAEGSTLTMRDATVRYACYVVSSTTLVGAFFVAFTDRRQALHDLFARTVIVKKRALLPLRSQMHD
jgi:Predicted membrane protein/domain